MLSPALEAIGSRFQAKLTERTNTRHVRQQTKAMASDSFTLERLLCDPQMGDFRQVSPVQRALMRAVDGLPVDLSGCASGTHAERMRFHFGCETLPLGVRPREVIVETGVRAGKTLISGGGILRSSLACRFRRAPEQGEIPDADGLIGVREGELVRTPIVGPTLDHCRAAFAAISSLMKGSPVLASMIVKLLTNSLLIRRPDGREVLIEKVATAAGGSNLRSTWLAGILFDEADFHGAETAAENLTAQIQAVRTRMLPGAQIWVASSPWSDASPFHEMHSKAFGFPSANALAFHSDSRSMHPSLSKELEATERQIDPVNAAREWDAIPLNFGSTRFFPEDAILKSVCRVDKDRPAHLPPVEGVRHYSGADWGFSKNSSALAIARTERGVVRLVYHEELQPTKDESLRPKFVVKRFAETAMRYRVRAIISDHYLRGILNNEFNDFAETIEDSFERSRVPARQEWDPNRDAQTELFTELRRRMKDGLVEIPNDLRLLAQLRAITSCPMPGGSVKILMPKQGTAHGDLAMAVALALVAAPCAAVAVAPPPPPRPPARRGGSYGDFCSDNRFEQNERGYG